MPAHCCTTHPPSSSSSRQPQFLHLLQSPFPYIFGLPMSTSAASRNVDRVVQGILRQRAEMLSSPNGDVVWIDLEMDEYFPATEPLPPPHIFKDLFCFLADRFAGSGARRQHPTLNVEHHRSSSGGSSSSSSSNNNTNTPPQIRRPSVSGGGGSSGSRLPPAPTVSPRDCEYLRWLFAHALAKVLFGYDRHLEDLRMGATEEFVAAQWAARHHDSSSSAARGKLALNSGGGRGGRSKNDPSQAEQDDDGQHQLLLRVVESQDFQLFVEKKMKLMATEAAAAAAAGTTQSPEQPQQQQQQLDMLDEDEAPVRAVRAGELAAFDWLCEHELRRAGQQLRW
jgi:hypothetical protein